jgi:hypothetical protein
MNRVQSFFMIRLLTTVRYFNFVGVSAWRRISRNASTASPKAHVAGGLQKPFKQMEKRDRRTNLRFS